MRPFTTKEIEEIAANHPLAAPGEIERDVEEYEKLISDLLLSEAPLPSDSLANRAPVAAAPSRLEQLLEKLFGG